MAIYSLRRYQQQRALAHAKNENTGLAGVFKSKQEAITVEPIPVNFVNASIYAILTTAQPVKYSTWQDLNGATIDELMDIPGIGRRSAEKILAAVEAHFSTSMTVITSSFGDAIATVS